MFSIRRTNGLSSIGTSDSVNMRYHGSTSTPGTVSTPNAVTYTTKDFDSHNAYSGSTYTVPISGKYQVNASTYQSAGTTATNEQLSLYIYHNGVGISQTVNQFTAAASATGVLVSDIINCVAGDTLQIFAGNNGTTPNIQSSSVINYVSISRVGN
jgi:hypothetical protein